MFWCMLAVDFSAICCDVLQLRLFAETRVITGYLRFLAATCKVMQSHRNGTQNPPALAAMGDRPPSRQQNKELRSSRPLKSGEAKIVWWLLVSACGEEERRKGKTGSMSALASCRQPRTIHHKHFLAHPRHVASVPGAASSWRPDRIANPG